LRRVPTHQLWHVYDIHLLPFTQLCSTPSLRIIGQALRLAQRRTHPERLCNTLCAQICCTCRLAWCLTLTSTCSCVLVSTVCSQGAREGKQTPCSSSTARRSRQRCPSHAGDMRCANETSAAMLCSARRMKERRPGAAPAWNAQRAGAGAMRPSLGQSGCRVTSRADAIRSYASASRVDGRPGGRRLRRLQRHCAVRFLLPPAAIASAAKLRSFMGTVHP